MMYSPQGVTSGLTVPGSRGAAVPFAAPVTALLVGALALLLAGCRGAETPVYTTQFTAFGTAVDVSIVGMPKQAAVAAAADIKDDFAVLHREFHAWQPGPLLRVNELLASGEPFAAPPALLPLLRKSQSLAAATDNLFNPTLGRLQDLWGFHSDTPDCRPPPATASIRRLVAAKPTMADLYLDGWQLQTSNPATQLDFSAIAPGYAVDLGIRTLRARGVRSALIKVGDDVRAIGSRAGRPWRVPVRRAGGAAVLGVIQVRGDASVFTASEARHNFIHDGTLYHHVLDPRTGWPATDFKAVTVMHDGDATTAAAAANALMVAGAENWQALARRLGITRVLLQEETGTVLMSPELAASFEAQERDLTIVPTAPLAGAAAPP